ncbi:cation:proton antiporter [Frankia sp. AgPm24]|uniref:cation:proton antiporter n=1 Tax=Frankia sp. AgPm24 TaxID=631128 RepID=UPI00200E2065|nr:cation:proton antiporter [Frankia sp. AgPm24]MCK9920713.1 cation:proton antiporter [Frankia sp. AgPm24]
MIVVAGPVAGLTHPGLMHLLIQLTVLLAGALALGRVAAYLGAPPVVGELLVGVLLGPSVLGEVWPSFADRLFPPVVEQMHLLDAIGQLGVILLVGITGLEVDSRLLRRAGSTAARVSLAGLLTPLALGVGVGFLLPTVLVGDNADRPTFALFIGVALGISAIPVAAKILIDMKLLHHPIGQLTLVAAVVDDAVGWLLLSVVSALATTGLYDRDLLISILAVPGFVLVAVLVLRPLAAALLRRVAPQPVGAQPVDAQPVDAPDAGEQPHPDEQGGIYLALVVAFVLASAATTHALHLEAIFGAFVAGMVIGSIRGFAAHRMAPLRTVVLGVLAPIFFATAGLRVDLGELAKPSVLLAGVVVLALAIIGKFTGAYLGARASGLGRWEGVALGSALNARGVVEVVLASAGLRLGVLTTASYTVIVLVAVSTSLMAPPLLRAAMRRVEQAGLSGALMSTGAGAIPAPSHDPAGAGDPAAPAEPAETAASTDKKLGT